VKIYTNHLTHNFFIARIANKKGIHLEIP